MPDSLSDRYAELLTGSYDCVDRIVLNAFFRMGHAPGGFRVWWQALTGSEETLDNAHLMRLAGRFSRRIHGYAKANGIPVVHCSAGERKHELAEEYLAKTNITQGLFLILVGRAQAPVWNISANHHIEPKKPMPYVNHYSFHILDPQWGHITIKISGHPPFPAQVILNGHEYVACQARKAGINFTKEGNCFTQISDAAGLAKIADTLSGPQAIGRLNQVCERWIYTTCLCFALELEEQKRSGFRYQDSNYQVEYSRNLIFEIGGDMDQVFQALIDRSRVPLDLETIKTILGYQRRPRYRQRKSKSAQWEVAVERPTYDLTILKLHCGKLTLKIYTKGERVLRIEVVVHNTQELQCGRSLEKFPQIVVQAKEILERFMNALSCIDQCFIADSMLDELSTPSRVGTTKVGGIDLNKPRMRWVVEAVIALCLSLSPQGFTASELARQVRMLSNQAEGQYDARRAAYDLKKLRGKKIVHRIGQTRRYQSTSSGLKAMVALVVLRNKAIKPLLAAAQDRHPSRGAQNPRPLDRNYETIRTAMQLFSRNWGWQPEHRQLFFQTSPLSAYRNNGKFESDIGVKDLSLRAARRCSARRGMAGKHHEPENAPGLQGRCPGVFRVYRFAGLHEATFHRRVAYHFLAQGHGKTRSGAGQHSTQALGAVLAFRLSLRTQRCHRQSSGRSETANGQRERRQHAGARRRAGPQTVGSPTRGHAQGRPGSGHPGYPAVSRYPARRTLRFEGKGPAQPTGCHAFSYQRQAVQDPLRSGERACPADD